MQACEQTSDTIDLTDRFLQEQIIRRYLETLWELNAVPRRRKSTIKSYVSAAQRRLRRSSDRTERRLLRAQLAKLQDELEYYDTSKQRALQSLDELVAFRRLFVAVAADFSERENIPPAAWRRVGVSSHVLACAGIDA
jgi:hypothetical protein